MRNRLFIVLMFCGFALRAQPPRHFRHFTEKDGLSDNRVQAIVRDGQGFVWVGTANGLNRYDGYNFRQYLPDPTHPDRSIGNENIYDLKIDRQGNLWIATRNGLNCYNPVSQRFRRWINEGREDGSLPNPIVWNMLVDSQDRLWLSLDNRGLCRYDETQDRFSVCPWREFVLKSLPETKPDAYLVIHYLSHKSAHEFWLQTNVGVFSFDWKQESFTYHPIPKQLEVAIQSEEQKGRCYFGSWNNDVLRLQPHTGEWDRICVPAPNSPPCSGQYVSMLLPYQDGNCVLTRFGLFWLPNASVHVESIKPLENEILDLPSGMLTDGLVDKDDVLWLGGESGLWLSEPQQRHFIYHPLQPQQPFVGDNRYTRFLELGDGRQLVLDFYFHELLVVQSSHIIQKVNLPERAALLHRDRHGKIWVGGGNEIYLLDTANLQLKPFAISASTWNPPAKGYFQDMAEDSKGRYWFAHSNNGLLVWNPADGQWWVPDSGDGFIGKHITCIKADSTRKTLWMGSEDFGLFMYDEQEEKFALYQHDPLHPQNSIAAYTIYDVFLDADGIVWIATDPGGLSRLDLAAEEGHQFLTINTFHGLPSNRITSIVADHRGRLWLSTLGGLACIEPQTGSIHAFNEEDGLPTEFLDQPLFLANDGSLYNGLKYGYFQFDPDSLLQTHKESSINLTSFKIFDQELGDSLALNTLDKLDLNWRANFFHLEWASADILAARKTQFAYRLQNFDVDWIQARHRHAASYTNVPPGDYVFEVKSGVNGSLDNVGLQLAIHIPPPFWQAWWFRVFVLATFAGIVYLTYRLRMRQIKREAALKSEFDQRIARTEMAALRAQMNPHFVFNCLSSINRFILVNQPEEASDYLTKFSRLIRLILDNSRTDTVLLIKELDALKLYIEMEQMRFSDRFEASIEVDARLQVAQFEVPPLLIQPYVENAIWHGLMHKKEACLLTIRLYPIGTRLCIEVEDNGVGRQMALELKSRSATNQKSHGMEVTSERLQVINRLYGTQATVETIDLRDDSGASAGTLIKILL